MANITNVEELRLLDNSMGTSPSNNRWLALFTGNPGETGSQVDEITGGSYARQPVTFNAATTVTLKGTATNNGDVEFGPATASWGTVTHMGICDAVTGGNVIWYGALSASKAIDSGDSLIFRDTDLVVTLD